LSGSQEHVALLVEGTSSTQLQPAQTNRLPPLNLGGGEHCWYHSPNLLCCLPSDW